MQKEFQKLATEFERITAKGYIKGIYNNLSSIGRTFEQELGLERNKESVPDYNGIEIKTRGVYSKSNITLFNAVPNGKEQNELKRIKDKYGYPCKKDKKYKVLYVDIYANKLTYGGYKYQYKLDVNKKDKKIYIQIYNALNELIDNEAYWDFEYLEQRLKTKLSHLAIINAWQKKIDGWNYFKYYKINYYTLKSFSKFIKMIENGKIRLTLKIGIYLDKENYGKMYDHGCGFGIHEEDIKDLFYIYDIDKNILI